MITQVEHTYTDDSNLSQRQFITPIVIAIPAGLGFGAVFTLLWPGLSLLAALGLWLLGLAIGFIGAALISQRVYDQAQWGMVFGGQIIGVFGIALLFVASLG